MKLKLDKEVRLAEAALLRDFEDVPMTAADEAQDREQRMQEARERHKERREAALSSLDHSVWPGYDASESPHLTAGRYENSYLRNDNEFTDDQLEQRERWAAKERQVVARERAAAPRSAEGEREDG